MPPGLRLLSWNVNGIRRCIRKCGFGSLRAFLDALPADIVCLQETKVSKPDLDHELGCPEGWTAFYSCSQVRSGNGYSGVATFCRAPWGPPLDAVEGPRVGPELVPRMVELLAAMGTGEGLHRNTPMAELESGLDSEGRVVITDHGAFLLCNVYCPAARHTDSYNNTLDPARARFRYQFLAGLLARLETYLRTGRELIMVGDLNVAPQPLDHCEGAVWEPTHKETFADSPPRRWMEQLLGSPVCEGGLADAFRHFQPTRTAAYTCWRLSNGARLTNYGARVDHVLCSRAMLSAVQFCDIWPAVWGSDHCPVVAWLSPDVRVAVRPGSASLPELCAALLPQCRRRQPTMREAFAASKTVPIGSEGGESPEPPCEAPVPLSDPAPTPPAPSIAMGKRLTTTTAGSQSKKKRSDSSNSKVASKQRGITAFFGTPAISCSNVNPASTADFTSQALGDESLGALIGASMPDQSTTIPSLESGTGLETAASSGSGGLFAAVSSAPPGSPSTLLGSPSNTAVQPPSFLSRKEQEAYLRTAHVAPLCRHREPCVRRVVAKEGANKGRAFWTCCRPQGLPSDPLSRCNHFEWATG